MIDGVKLKKLVKHCDDRGYFMELLRVDEEMFGPFEQFGQASMSMSYPGVIKAFHYHAQQDDIWYFPFGSAQAVLYDFRPHSVSRGQTAVYYMGEDNPYLLFIPRGVVHGYRVLGLKPAVIVYFTNTAYDPSSPDEYRIPYDDPAIGFDWRTRNR